MRRLTRLELAVVATPVVASLLAAITFSLGPTNTETFTADETAALDSARARLGSMLTFSYRNLEADITVAASNATGSFRDEYAKRLRKLMTASEKTSRTSVSSRVERVALIDADPAGVTVLAELRVRTENENRRPTNQAFQVRAQLRGSGSQWLVSSLTLL